MNRSIALFLVLFTLFLASGCTTALTRSGTYVDAFKGTDSRGKHYSKGVNRERVIAQYGRPCATKKFTPSISVGEARKAGLLRSRTIGSITLNEGADMAPGARIARVDEFQIRGPVVNTRKIVNAGFTETIGRYTLGLSEAVFFPFAAASYIGELGDVSEIYVFYSAEDEMLGETSVRTFKRGEESSSRLR